MSLLLVLVVLLGLVAFWLCTVVGLSLLSFLLYQFVSRKKVTKRQIKATFGALLGLFILLASIAFVTSSGFDSKPGEPQMSNGDLIVSVIGIVSFNVLVGVCAARIAERSGSN